jgi:prepilin-type N-terminal cleavage/methylation domain-containing protein
VAATEPDWENFRSGAALHGRLPPWPRTVPTGFTLLEVLLAAALLALLLGYVGSALAQQARELRRSRADAAAVASARLATSLIVEAARRYDELGVTANGRRLLGRVSRAGGGGGGQQDLILSLEDGPPDGGQGHNLTPDSFRYNGVTRVLERYTGSAWEAAVDGLADVTLRRKYEGDPKWIELTVTAEPPGATGPYTVSTWLRLERP